MNDVRICPYCGCGDSRVGESSVNKGNGFLYRRRTCCSCRQSWRTYEVEADMLKKLLWFYRSSGKLLEKYPVDVEGLMGGRASGRKDE